MAFTYAVDTPAAARSGSTAVAGGFGNLFIVSGTFTNTAGTTKGTIVTGLSHVIAYQTRIESGTITEEHRSNKNVDGDGAAAAGSIGILTIVSGNQNGNWFAIGY